MRHGIAVDRLDPDCPPDPDRPLVEKGRERTALVADRLRAAVPDIERWITSPYLRARQTSDIVAARYGVKPRAIERSPAWQPLASPETSFRTLTGTGAESIIVFGHLPNLDDVIAWLLGTSRPVTRLKKAAVAALSVDTWQPGDSTLQWLLTPKLCR